MAYLFNIIFATRSDDRHSSLSSQSKRATSAYGRGNLLLKNGRDLSAPPSTLVERSLPVKMTCLVSCHLERSREVSLVKQQFHTPSYPSPTLGEGTRLSPYFRGRIRGGTFCQTTPDISPNRLAKLSIKNSRNSLLNNTTKHPQNQ